MLICSAVKESIILTEFEKNMFPIKYILFVGKTVYLTSVHTHTKTQLYSYLSVELGSLTKLLFTDYSMKQCDRT